MIMLEELSIYSDKEEHSILNLEDFEEDKDFLIKNNHLERRMVPVHWIGYEEGLEPSEERSMVRQPRWIIDIDGINFLIKKYNTQISF